MWMLFSGEIYNPGSHSSSKLIAKYSEFHLKKTENYKMIYFKICRQKAHLKQNTMSLFSSLLRAEWNTQKHIHNRSKSLWQNLILPNDSNFRQAFAPRLFPRGCSSVKVIAETHVSRTMCHLQPRQSTVK